MFARALAPALALALAFAGCVTPPPDGTTPPGGVGALAFTMDCAIATTTGNWSDPCTALASPNDSPSKTEIDLVVNPTDPLNVVVASKDLDKKASDCVWAVAQVTKDGGKTWTTVYVGGDKASREPVLAALACITDPIMAFDSKGVLYYALQAYEVRPGGQELPELPVLGQPSGGSTFMLTRSKDGGLTWDKFTVMHAGDGVAVFHDYPRMLVGPKTQAVHTIWNGVGAAGVTPWVVTTRDGGETVDPPVTFQGSDAPTGTSFESGFAATKDGQIFVTAAKFGPGPLGAGGGETSVYIFTSTDDARSFTEVGKAVSAKLTPRQLDGKYNQFRTPSFFEMTADQSGGAYADRLYIFWPDYRTGDSDILSSWSSDKGKTWSEPAPVHADRTNDQLTMRPTVDANGVVHVLFWSRAYDPENKLLDAMHAWSSDGGVTWHDQRLTTSGFDGDLGIHQNGFPFIGDYNGIGVGPDGAVWMSWADTRTGRAEIAVAKVIPR